MAKKQAVGSTGSSTGAVSAGRRGRMPAATPWKRQPALADLRVAEVTKMDIKVENGKVAGFRTRVALSFK